MKTNINGIDIWELSENGYEVNLTVKFKINILPLFKEWVKGKSEDDAISEAIDLNFIDKKKIRKDIYRVISSNLGASWDLKSVDIYFESRCFETMHAVECCFEEYKIDAQVLIAPYIDPEKLVSAIGLVAKTFSDWKIDIEG